MLGSWDISFHFFYTFPSLPLFSSFNRWSQESVGSKDGSISSSPQKVPESVGLHVAALMCLKLPWSEQRRWWGAGGVEGRGEGGISPLISVRVPFSSVCPKTLWTNVREAFVSFFDAVSHSLAWLREFDGKERRKKDLSPREDNVFHWMTAII